MTEGKEVIPLRPSGKKGKKYGKWVTAALAAASAFLITALGTAQYFTPDEYRVTRGNSLEWNSQAISLSGTRGEGDLPAGTATASNGKYRAEVMLFHTIPVKTVDVDVVEESHVTLCGTPF